MWPWQLRPLLTHLQNQFFSFSFILFPRLSGVVVWSHAPPGSTAVHFIKRQNNNLFDTILNFFLPYSLRSSALPSTLYFNFHRLPSFLRSVPVFSSPVPFQCPCICPLHQCRSYHCHVTFHLIFTFIFPSHNTPDTLFQFVHPLCTRWWLARPFLHPPPTEIPGVWMSSLSLIDICLLVFIAPQVFSLLSTLFIPHSSMIFAIPHAPFLHALF